MCEEALQNNGKALAGGIESLNSLKQLVELAEHAARAESRQYWIAAVGLVITLFVTSVLLFMHTEHTEIGLDVTVAGLAFSLDGDQILALDSHLISIGVSGLRKIELSDPDWR